MVMEPPQASSGLVCKGIVEVKFKSINCTRSSLILGVILQGSQFAMESK